MIHHAYMHTFASADVVKIIENQDGVAMVLHSPQKAQVIQQLPMPIQIPTPVVPPIKQQN